MQKQCHKTPVLKGCRNAGVRQAQLLQSQAIAWPTHQENMFYSTRQKQMWTDEHIVHIGHKDIRLGQGSPVWSTEGCVDEVSDPESRSEAVLQGQTTAEYGVCSQRCIALFKNSSGDCCWGLMFLKVVVCVRGEPYGQHLLPRFEKLSLPHFKRLIKIIFLLLF